VRQRADGSATRVAAVTAIVAVVVGIVLRIAVLRSRLGPVDADEAVVGLMARDLLHGHVQAFYWGQAYGGIHEQVVVAMLLLVRTPGWLAMELAPIGWAAAAVLVWRIGRRVLGGGEPAAMLAGAFTWVSSGAFVWLSTKERGFYGATLVIGLAALLFALRLVDRPTRRDAAALGLAVGTGWYASPQVTYLAVPAALVVIAALARRDGLTPTRGAVLAQLPLVAAGAVVGALPWIAANVHSGFASLHLAATVPHTTYADRLTIFFRHALPIATGLKVPFTLRWIGPAARPAYAFFLVTLAAVAVVAIVRSGRRGGNTTWAIAIGLLAYPFVYAAFPTSYYFGDPRYLYLLWPLVALLAVDASCRAHVVAGALTVLVAAVVAAVTLQRMASLPWTPDQATHDIAPLAIGPAADALERHHDHLVYADYWLSYRLTFATDRHVVAAPLQLIRSDRDERDVAERVATEPVPYVLVAESCYDRTMRQALDAAGIAFDVERAGRVAIVRPDRPVAPPALLPEWAAARGIDPHRSAAC
jgi:hypothetical protein